MGFNPESINIKVLNQEYKFFYPNKEILECLLGILIGKEYPYLNLPNYYPENIFDIGANIGASSILFYSLFSKSIIYSYEPSLECQKYLKLNLEKFSNIKVFNYGLFDKEIEIQLYKGKNHFAQNSIYKYNSTSQEFETVKLRMLSKDLDKHNIKHLSILKIDTEGSEINILNDIKDFFSEIDHLYIEYHSENDRLEIDNLISKYFILYFSRSIEFHRGFLYYVSKSLLNKYKYLDLEKKEIKAND